MFSKNLFLVQFIFHLFYLTLSNIQNDEQFIIENQGYGYINIKRIEFNNYLNKNILKIILEITNSVRAIFVVPNKGYKTPYFNRGQSNKKIYYVGKSNLRDGNTEINIVEDFDNNYREGIVICGRLINKRIFVTLMRIKPLFHNKLYIEPKEVDEDFDNFKLMKFEWFLDFKNQKNNLIKICLKFKNKGEYLINLATELLNNKLLEFNFKIDKEMLINCKIFNEKIEESELIKLKEKIFIYYYKINEEINFEEYNVEDDSILLLNITEIEPLISDGIYEFYFENNGNIKQKKENIIKYLNKRELNKTNKNKILPLFKEELDILIDGNYFKRNKNGKIEKLKASLENEEN
ncbi:unnamed protein product [Meloidogyne enterolobii]|uniref:Uncharacterized protein n=1 Tax=Meloidogyne enterolobii TaxID=390850 RepID=A0ACB0ZWM6_MELEN